MVRRMSPLTFPPLAKRETATTAGRLAALLAPAGFALVALASGIAPITACTPGPAITVIRPPPGEKAEETAGDPVKLKHASQESYAGARGGQFVVRTLDDWNIAWPSGQAPTMPPTVDPATQMMFLAVAENKDIAKIRIDKAIETGAMIAVYVKETKRGQGCVRKADERVPVDAVVTTRVDKPIRFYVEEEQAESCGEPPTADVQCRVGGNSPWQTKIVANVGDNVECKLDGAARGKYELVERLLFLGDAPPGSLAKLSFGKELTRAAFSLDVFGVYAIRAEAKDEAGRKGGSIATIEALPKKTRDPLIQLAWADVDIGTDPTTLPRVTLRVAQPGSKGQRCSADVPVPGLCEARASGSATYMRIPAQAAKLALSVLYIDEKAEKGPATCLQVWFDGQRSADLCDRKARAAEDRWEVGTLDTATGAIADVPPPAAAGDGGAPEPSATDAGAPKPKTQPKKPAKK